MLDNELYAMFELLKDDPEARSLLWAVSQDPQIKETVRILLRNRIMEMGWDPNDLPKFGLARDISPSDYLVAKVISDKVLGEDIGPSEEDLDSHIGIFGLTGIGKSTLSKLLLIAFTKKQRPASEPQKTFFVWDIHGDYIDLLPLYEPEELIWIPADELGINLLEVPVGPDGRPIMSPEKWISELREWLRLLWLNEPSVNLFCEVLYNEYQKRGILGDGKGEYPSISDIIDAVERLDAPKGSSRAVAKEKLLDRLKSLRALLPGLDVQRSRDINRLFRGRSIILDLQRVKDIALPVLFAYITILFREIFWSDGDPTIHRMEVIEEAHQLLGGFVDKRTSDLNEGIATGILRELRKSGTCGVVISQLVHDLSKSIRGNLGTVFSFRQGDKDCIEHAAAALNLESWQKTELAKLPDRQAIGRFSRYGEPIHIAINDARPLFAGFRRLSRTEARERSRPVLESMPFVKRNEAKANEEEKKVNNESAVEGGLPTDELQWYAHFLKMPWELRPDRINDLGMKKDADGRMIAKFEVRGCISCGGTVGAKFKVHRPTARGIQLANKLGLTVSTPRMGSIAHESIIQYTSRSLLDYFSLELKEIVQLIREGVFTTTAGVQPDLMVIRGSGQRFAMQACYRNQAANEACALLKLHELSLLGPEHADRIEFVLAIAVNKKHKSEIERAIKEKNNGVIPQKICLLDFDSMLDANWDDVFDSVI